MDAAIIDPPRQGGGRGQTGMLDLLGPSELEGSLERPRTVRARLERRRRPCGRLRLQEPVSVRLHRQNDV
jgi:hypothetical protein